MNTENAEYKLLINFFTFVKAWYISIFGFWHYQAVWGF